MPSYIQNWCNDCNKGCGRTCKKSTDAESPWKCHDTCLKGTSAYKTFNPVNTAVDQSHQLIRPLDISITGVGASSSGGSVSFNIGAAASASSRPGWTKDGRAAWMEYRSCGSDPEKNNCCTIHMPDGYSTMANDGTGTTLADPAGTHGISSGATRLSETAYAQMLDEYIVPDDDPPAFWCEAYKASTVDTSGTQAVMDSSADCNTSKDITYRAYALCDGNKDVAAAAPSTPAAGYKDAWPSGSTKIEILQADGESLPFAYVSVLIWLGKYELSTEAECYHLGLPVVNGCWNEYGPKAWRITYRKELATACSCDVAGTYAYYSSSIQLRDDATGRNCQVAKCTASVSALDTCVPNSDSSDGWYHQGYASYAACVSARTAAGCLDGCSFDGYAYHTQAGCTPESDSGWSGSCCCTAASCMSGCARTNPCETTDASPANGIYGGGVSAPGAGDCAGGSSPEYSGLCDCSPSGSSEAAPITAAYFPPAINRNGSYTVVPGTCVVTQRDYVAI